jgi:hypothetical protein
MYVCLYMYHILLNIYIYTQVKLPLQPQSAGVKRYPRIENVPFPGRTAPVAVVLKLAVPAGFERDLAEVL